VEAPAAAEPSVKKPPEKISPKALRVMAVAEETPAEPVPARDHEEATSVPITVQPDGHCLITTGDRVGFPVPRGKAIQPEERYGIYKQGTSPLNYLRGFNTLGKEQVGKVKIIEVQDAIIWGRVVAANDIILAGDKVVFGAP
jgi:hypothetical protein